MRKFHNLKSISVLTVFSIFVSLNSASLALANPTSSACKKVKSSTRAMDEKSLSIWKKFDARRDSMGTLRFSNSEYKNTLTLLKSIYQSDISTFNNAKKSLSCYSSQEVTSINNAYDNTIEALASLNKIIATSNSSSETKFNSMKETIWLWIAGEYMNFYTLDGRSF